MRKFEEMAQNPRPAGSNLTKITSVVGVSLLLFLFDWFFMVYSTAHGFEVKTQNFPLGGFNLQLPLQWLSVIGVLLVSLVVWYEVSAQIFPRRAGPEVDPLGNARIMRVIVFSLTTFVCILYIPYLLGSNWFWSEMSGAGRIVTQLRDFGLSLLHTQEPAMTLYPLWQYSITQILATGAMVTVAWLFSRTARRPRKLR